ncbi:MAG: TonB family protein [Acidobacteria bacterium]|nr:TonB family protein [Acidobacteriota bacterium]
MRLLLASLLVLLVTSFPTAQSASAVFSGFVSDPNGEPVEGSTIYLTSVATKEQLEFVTGPEGRFEFSGLPAGDYRVTSMTPGIMPFVVTLPADERVHRDITLPFGPFSGTWTIVRNPTAPARTGGPPRPDNFRCAERGMPLCGVPSIVEEFERDEIERLKHPVLAPRTTRMPSLEEYPQPLQDAGVQGTVVIEVRVGVDGALDDARIVSTDHPELVEPALASMRAARWEPARLRGVAVEAPMTFTIQFRLESPQPMPRRRLQRAQATVTQAAARGPQAEQTDAPRPAFEVASVKPNNSGAPRVSMQTMPGGRFNAFNQTLRGLIRFAYGLQDFQLIGPGWIDEARFDITASAGRQPGPGEIQQMMRSLLAERFNLVVHRETRDSPMFALVLARGDGRLGPQLRPSVEGACTPLGPGPPPVPPAGGGPQPCGTTFGGGGRLTGRAVTMAQLANNFSNQTGRVVVDRTGLTGTFDFELESAGGRGGGLGPLPPQPGEPPPPPDDRPALATAIQEQLGLRFESTRGPVEVTMVDRVEQPTPD